MPKLPVDIVENVTTGHDDHHEELHKRYNAAGVFHVPAGATRAEAQAVVDEAEATYLGADGGGGIVLLEPGRYDWTGTLLVKKTGLSIESATSAGCSIYHTGAGACIKWANDPTTVQQQGQIKGITIYGDATAGAVGVHCLDTGTTPAFRDVVVYGFTGTNAVGIWLENVGVWNERLKLDRVHLDNNTRGLLLSSPSGSAYVSFGYARVTDLRLNVNAGQIGIQSSGSAFVYNGFWDIQCNGSGSSTLIQVDAESNWTGVNIRATAEGLGTGVNVVTGGRFNISGFWNPDAPDIGTVEFGFCYNSAGQLRSNDSEAPSVAMGSNAGPGVPAPVVIGNSLAGHVTFGTGSPTAAGDLMVITWQREFPNSTKLPSIAITPLGRDSAALQLYVTARSSSQWTVGSNVAPAADQPNTKYGFTYVVIG